MAATFPPNVCQNFTLLSVHHDHGMHAVRSEAINYITET